MQKDNSNNADWNSPKGPQPGTKLKGGAAPSPPAWKYECDDIKAFDKFCKKVHIWKLQASAFISTKDMALSFYTSLQGELEQELEHLTVDEFYRDDGVDVLSRCLKQPLQHKLVYQKPRFLHEFEVLPCGRTLKSW